jgi:phytoene desaturase
MVHSAGGPASSGQTTRYPWFAARGVFEGRRAVGARTAEACHQADAVIVNADFAHAMTRLVPGRRRRRWSDRNLARKRYSCSTFMLYLGVEGRFDHLAHHTIYMARDYARNLDEIERRPRPLGGPVVLRAKRLRHRPDPGPPGCSTLYVLVPVTHQHPNVDWAKERDRYRGVALRQLGRVGIEDVSRRIRCERVVTPADWEAMGIYRGATFSLAHSLGQMLHLRPPNRFDELKRVYLVGGGTHQGSGLPVIFESARISTRWLLEDLGAAPAEPAEPRARPAVPLPLPAPWRGRALEGVS